MCMISLPVDTVSKTKIFIGLNEDKTRQLTVYSNNVANISKSNAMVIPVPYPNLVNFHDMSQNKFFFKDVDKSFVLETPPAKYLGTTDSLRDFILFDLPLPVFDVGSYKVSIVPQFSDMCYLDENFFILSEELKFILSHTYHESYWGFIVFVLADDETKEYHPFAYSHQVVNHMIYVPTRHYHCHNPYKYKESYGSYFGEVFDSNLSVNEQTKKRDDVEDWDHTIYLYNCSSSIYQCQNLELMKSTQFKYRFTGDFHFDKNKIDFDLHKCDCFEKYRIKGNYKNIDIMIPFEHYEHILKSKPHLHCNVI